MEDKIPAALETERLLLRGFTTEDAAELYEYAKNPNVGPHAGWKPHESIEESLEIITDLFLVKYHIWAIVDKASGKMIGSIGLEEDSKRPAQLYGTAMRWTKGFGARTDDEAAEAVIRWRV